MISLSDNGLEAESYLGEVLAISKIGILWKDGIQKTPKRSITLRGNSPNPWTNSTKIVFHLPHSGMVNLIVTDINGRRIFSNVGEFEAGQQEWKLTREELPAGVLLYELQFEDQQTTDLIFSSSVRTHAQHKKDPSSPKQAELILP